LELCAATLFQRQLVMIVRASASVDGCRIGRRSASSTMPRPKRVCLFVDESRIDRDARLVPQTRDKSRQ
jgi:hypothetical protein